MKSLSYILIVAGLIVAVIAVYLSRPSGVAEARVTVAKIVPDPSTPFPSSSLEQLTNEAKEARVAVTNKLSNLYTKKAVSASTFESFVEDLPQLDLQEAKEGLKKAAEAFGTLKKEALDSQGAAQEAFSKYESALTRSFFAALDKPASQPGMTLDSIVAVVGAVVSIAGLVLNWQAFKAENAKFPLEVEKLREEIRKLRTKH